MLPAQQGPATRRTANHGPRRAPKVELGNIRRDSFDMVQQRRVIVVAPIEAQLELQRCVYRERNVAAVSGVPSDQSKSVRRGTWPCRRSPPGGGRMVHHQPPPPRTSAPDRQSEEPRPVLRPNGIVVVGVLLACEHRPHVLAVNLADQSKRDLRRVCRWRRPCGYWRESSLGLAVQAPAAKAAAAQSKSRRTRRIWCGAWMDDRV